MKRGVKKLYQKYTESKWDDDIPDVHKKHRRRWRPSQRRKLRRFVQRETKKLIKEHERV